jgi:mannose PTS system EIID component
MSVMDSGDARRVLLRSFTVQGSFNYETLIGTGFAFTLTPLLRRVYRDDPDGLRDAIERHSRLFNSHPYFVTLAVGAVARLEAERTDPAIIERYKSALRGSLGSMGDQLVWQAWRPASALLAIVLLLLGAHWLVAAGAFLVVFNGLHLYLRQWGLRVGYSEGLKLGQRLRDAPFTRWNLAAARAGIVLAGIASILALGSLGPANPELWIGALAVPLGLWLGARTRKVVFLAWLGIFVAGLIYSATLGSIP